MGPGGKSATFPISPRQRATEDKGARRYLARLRRLTSLQPSRWEQRGHYLHEVDPAGRHYPSFGVIFEPLRLWHKAGAETQRPERKA